MKPWKKMLMGLGLGVLVGILIGPKAQYVKPFGTVFLTLLNMLIVPLVFSSMCVGITSISDIRKLGRVGFKTLLLFVVTTMIAIVFGLFAAHFIKPGAGMGLSYSRELALDNTPALSKMFLDLVPTNPIGSLATGNILQVIIFAIFLGLGINFAGEKGKPLARFMESLSEVMFAMTRLVMKLAPFGIFFIMIWVTGTFGVAILFPLLKLIFAIYLASIIHLVVVFGGILIFLAKVRVGPFFKGMGDAIAMAISTTSSSATLPTTLHCVEQNLGVSKNIANFILPLGCTINMNGTAIFQAIAALFIAQCYGIDLTIVNMITIVATATLSAVGCAGIPGAGIVTLSIVLSTIGLPLEGIAIVAGIDRIRDIIGTVLNVLGDGVVAVYVAKSEKEFDETCYNHTVNVSYQEGAMPTESKS